jgi:hypothetical protein
MDGPSFKERRKQLDERHPSSAFRYIPKNLAVFGQDGISVTIGCSRKPPRPPEDSPGPATYELACHTFDIDIPHQIQKRPETDYRTLSPGVTFNNLDPFVAPLISRRNPERPAPHLCERRYFTINDTPAPSYFRPTEQQIRPLTIGPPYHRDPPNSVPGPGAYPMPDPGASAIGFTIPRDRGRDTWQGPRDSPPPGEYEVGPVLPKPKRWAGKLRVPSRSRRRTSLNDEIRHMELDRGARTPTH